MTEIPMYITCIFLLGFTIVTLRFVMMYVSTFLSNDQLESSWYKVLSSNELAYFGGTCIVFVVGFFVGINASADNFSNSSLNTVNSRTSLKYRSKVPSLENNAVF